MPNFVKVVPCLAVLAALAVSVQGNNFYTQLGLQPSASDVDIQRAYQNLAVHYHPSQDSSEEAAHKFKQLSNAFELLSNTPMRRRYDEALAAQPQVDGSPSGHVVPSDFKFSDSLAVFDRFFGEPKVDVRREDGGLEISAQTAPTPDSSVGSSIHFSASPGTKASFSGTTSESKVIDGHTHTTKTTVDTIEDGRVVRTIEKYVDGELVGRSTEEEGGNEPAALPAGTVPTLQLQDGAAGEEPAGDGSVTSLVTREELQARLADAESRREVLQKTLVHQHNQQLENHKRMMLEHNQRMEEHHQRMKEHMEKMRKMRMGEL